MNKLFRINHLRFVAVFAAAVLITSSCKEKIKLNLESAAPHLVIEANISDQPGPYYVFLTKSNAYYQNNNFPAISGATIVVSDDAGVTDSLKEVSAGIYATDSSYQGVPGRTYRLTVISEGQQYDAVCHMPQPVSLDSAGTYVNSSNHIRAFCVFTDPPNESNYYRLSSYQHNFFATSSRALSDRLTNGTTQVVNVPTDTAIVSGDTIIVELESIDKPVFDYFNSLRTNTTSGLSAAPANPTTNITNNGLGYFSAYSVKTKTVVAP